MDLSALSELSEKDIDRKAISENRKLGIDMRRLAFYAVPSIQKVDVRELRKRLGLSQSDFASRFGLKLRTIQQWEQGRTEPDLPAKVLLATIAAEPDIVARVVWSSQWTSTGATNRSPELKELERTLHLVDIFDADGAISGPSPNAEKTFAA